MPNSVTTTITKSVAQAGLPFSSSAITVTGTVAPYIEAQVANGTPLTVNISLDVNLNMFYYLTDNVDQTVKFYTLAGGAGTLVNTWSPQAGVALEWDTSMPNSAAPIWNGSALLACLSMVITTGTTADGISTSLTTTACHARSSMTS